MAPWDELVLACELNGNVPLEVIDVINYLITPALDEVKKNLNPFLYQITASSVNLDGKVSYMVAPPTFQVNLFQALFKTKSRIVLSSQCGLWFEEEATGLWHFSNGLHLIAQRKGLLAIHGVMKQSFPLTLSSSRRVMFTTTRLLCITTHPQLRRSKSRSKTYSSIKHSAKF